MSLKRYRADSVLDAARARIAWALDRCSRAYVSFSGGKDSTVLLHLAAQECRARGRKLGVLIVDLEAQYAGTIANIERCLTDYADVLDVHWVCLPIKLRNAVSSFEPTWCAWDPDATAAWVREKPTRPGVIATGSAFPFFEDRMEFEEFIDLFGAWYAQGERCAAFIGIRADESLNRFRTVASGTKAMLEGQRFTTLVVEECYNVYPLYDWRTEDIWRFHGKHPGLAHNVIYDKMHLAGVPLSQQRLCQPYGDDQRRGLWLFHVIEPETWARVVARVAGANSGALYVTERGNVSGYAAISKPDGHTWQSFAELMLGSLPGPTRAHYTERFKSFIAGWRGRGYTAIPDEAPRVLENAHWAPSWRRICKVLLRNDWWCKGLGLQQPKSAAYERYMKLRAARRQEVAA